MTGHCGEWGGGAAGSGELGGDGGHPSRRVQLVSDEIEDARVGVILEDLLCNGPGGPLCVIHEYDSQHDRRSELTEVREERTEEGTSYVQTLRISLPTRMYTRPGSMNRSKSWMARRLIQSNH